MSRFTSLVRRLAKEDDGLETIEYAVMTAMIVAVLVAVLIAVEDAMSGRYGEMQAILDGN
jgi:Flp pilus assembly pilin Flp